MDWTAFTPDGNYAYTADCGNVNCNVAGNLSLIQNPESNSPSIVTVVSTGELGTNQVDLAPNCVSSSCTMYVSNVDYGASPGGNFQVFGNADSGLAPSLISTITSGFCNPNYFAITPDSKQVIISDVGKESRCSRNDSLDIFSAATESVTNTITNTTIKYPWTVAVMPDPAPTANFTVTPSAAGQATYFDGSASSSPVGTIASYAWNFGDGCTETTSAPTATVSFSYPSVSGGACPGSSSGTVTSSSGTYTATLTVTNTGGTSNKIVYTGHTVSNDGGPSATATHIVTLPTKLVVTASPSSGVTSSSPNVGPITVQMETSLGSPINSPPAASGLTDTLSLSATPSSGAVFSAYSGGVCSATTITSINFAAGTSSVSLCFGDATASSYTLTMSGSGSASGLTSASQVISISNPGPYQIAVGTSPESALCMSCGGPTTPNMGPITVQVENAGGSATNAGAGGVSVALTSSSATGEFSLYSGGVCQAAIITSATIASGTPSVQVCYGDTTQGTPTITLTSTGLTVNTATQIETVAGPATQTAFTTSAESALFVTTGGNPDMGPITVSLEDSSNRVTQATSSTTVTMSSTLPGGGAAYFSAYSGGVCQTTKVTTFSIANGASSVTLCFGYTIGDTNPQLTATVSGLIAGTQTETVSAGAPNQIVITSASVSGPASSTPNLGPITVSLEDTGGFLSNATTNETITLSSSSSTGLFSAYSGGVCQTTLVTSVTITSSPASDQAQVCYSDTTAGSPTITVTASPTLPGSSTFSQIETVKAAAPSVLIFTSASLTNVADSTPNVGPIGMELEDQFGNPSPASSTYTVSLSSTSGTGNFSAYSGGACQATLLTSITIGVGADGASICYGDTKSGTPTITLTTTGLTINSASQQETIDALSPDNLVIVTSPSGGLSGPPSSTPNLGPINLEIQDAYGNPTNAITAETISLSSSSGTGQFSLWTGTVCSSATITSATINMGSSQISICYGDSTANITPKITTTASPLLPGTSNPFQYETIMAGYWISDSYSNDYQQALTGDFYGVVQDSTNMIAVGDDGVTPNDPGGADYGQVSYQQGTGNINLTRIFDGHPVEYPVPLPTIHSGKALKSISCVSPSFCAAVDAAGSVETYNGVSWTAASNVDGSNVFNSVSCVGSPPYCLAVDSNGNAFYYTGTLFVPTSAPGDGATSLTSVACISTAVCVVVDGAGNALTYDQATNVWTVPTAVDPSAINSISCASTTLCIAVDNVGSYLTYNSSSNTWAGPTATGAGVALVSVSCIATTTTCVAVSGSGGIYTTTNSGGSWTSVATGASLTSVSCFAPTHCAAVTSTGAVLFYDGTTWTSTTVDSGVSINSISCVTSSFCIGVDSSGYGVPLLNNGDTSSIVSGPLYGATCPAVTQCILVGQNYGYTAGFILTTSDPTNPNGWAVATVPAGITDLTSVTCASTTICFAGGYGGATGTVNKGAALIESTDGGTTWTDISASIGTLIPGGELDAITGITCVSTTECFAAGQGLNSGSYDGAIVYYNGTAWKVQSYEASNGEFTGIDCPSASTCVASGESGSIAAVYDNSTASPTSGGSWSLLFTTTAVTYLYGIGCISASNCYTAGWVAPGGGGTFNGKTLVAGGAVLSGNPTSASSWGKVENDSLGGVTSVETTWYGVDCNTVSCSVVGINNQSPYYPMAGSGS